MLNGPDGKPMRGVGAGVVADPRDGRRRRIDAGRARTRRTASPTRTRTFLVNQYQPARLNKELEWAKKSLRPRRGRVANCKVTRAEGGPVANKPVVVEVRVDDATVRVAAPLKTDAEGRVAVRFELPAIDRPACQPA